MDEAKSTSGMVGCPGLSVSGPCILGKWVDPCGLPQGLLADVAVDDSRDRDSLVCPALVVRNTVAAQLPRISPQSASWRE